jgi:hypothetical protein
VVGHVAPAPRVVHQHPGTSFLSRHVVQHVLSPTLVR